MIDRGTVTARNEAIRNSFGTIITETTGLTRIYDIIQSLDSLTPHISSYPHALSIVEVGIGSNPIETLNENDTKTVFRSTLTPWFLWAFLNKKVQNPHLRIIEQNPLYIDQLAQSVLFVDKRSVDLTESHAIAWKALEEYINEPTYEIHLGISHYLRNLIMTSMAVPAGFASYPWVDVINEDATTLDIACPWNADIVFARNLTYQMCMEAQKLFLDNIRQNYMGKKDSYLVLTDCTATRTYRQALMKENKGWLSREALGHIGFEVCDKKSISGIETSWHNYILRSM